MKAPLKITIVAAGYLVALLAASAAVALNEARLRALSDPASDGMAAFGDLVLFLLVFAAIALLPTAAAIYFLVAKKKHAHRVCRNSA